MEFIKKLRQFIAIPIVFIGLICLVIAGWLALDEEDWSASYRVK